MPTPTKAIIEAHARCGTTLSISAFYKRFLANKKRNPSLTLEEFEADPSRFERRRAVKIDTKLVIAGQALGITKVAELLGEAEGVAKPFLGAIRRFIVANPDRRVFNSIDELRPLLERGVGGAKPTDVKNPIRYEGVFYPNVARFYEAIEDGNRDRIMVRTFSDRILEERRRRGLAAGEELSLTADELKSLCWLQDRLDNESFYQRVNQYCDTFRVDFVTKDGKKISAEQAYEIHYKSNTTKFYFSCRQCCEEDGYMPYAKAVAKFNQGCPRCAEAKRAAARRTPKDKIIKRVNTHALGLTYVHGAEEGVYKNRRSPITVKANACGHVFSRPADDFREKGRLMVCPKCKQYVGETLSVMITGHLLGLDIDRIIASRESTPDWLRKEEVKSDGHLRHDAYFESVLPCGRGLILEHQGFQHEDNVNHYFYSQDADAQARLKRNDKLKQRLAKARSDQVAFVTIHDVVKYCKDMDEAVQWIIRHLIEQAPEIQKIPGFSRRMREIRKKRFIYDLVSRAGLAAQPESRLRKALDEEGNRHIQIKGYDPVARRFSLECYSPNHKQLHIWSVTAVNVLPSRDGAKRGTRCPECARLARPEKYRLTEGELDNKSVQHGLRRGFDYSNYKNNRERYHWLCIKCGHDNYVSVEKMNGCADCRKEKYNLERQIQEFGVVKRIVEANRDTMISTVDDYINNSSDLTISCTRLGGCGALFTMKAGKIKQGQLHGCDKHIRSGVSRRRGNAPKYAASDKTVRRISPRRAVQA